MRDFEKLLLTGISAYGAYRAGQHFFGKLDSMDRRGFNVVDVIAVFALGAVLLNRINDTAALLA